PTLALDTPYNREVLGADDQLFPHDAERLTERIRTVLGNGAYQAELIRRGRAIVSSRYCWENVCAGYLELMEHVASNRRNRRYLPRAASPAAESQIRPSGTGSAQSA
ncbi:MAG TPA: hypothetical protein VF711_10585, partial [Acidimicrobiales bacterium]